MSDYTTSNQGIGGKGALIGLLAIVLVLVGLAFLGSSGSEVEPGTAVIDSTSPAADTDPAPVATE